MLRVAKELVLAFAAVVLGFGAQGALASTLLNTYDSFTYAYDTTLTSVRDVSAVVVSPGVAAAHIERVEAGSAQPVQASSVGVAANTAERAATACFVAGTPILLADGTSKPIEQVAVGDKVTAYDPDTGQTETRDVVRTFVHHDVPTYEVTPEHGWEGHHDPGASVLGRRPRMDTRHPTSGR